MDPNTKNTALGAAGAGAAAGLGVEDVFSTYLYEDSGSTQTITNGIDLNGEGGMVVVKTRTSSSWNHQVFDTERGASQLMYWNLTSSSGNNTPFGVNAFNSDGFDVEIGATGQDMVSWTFRKAPGFFDVVTYTGDGTGERSISHNLGAVPAVMIHRRYTSTSNWLVYHKDATSLNQYLLLNSTDAVASQTETWGTSAPTSTTFNIKSSYNAVGESYVVYLFAHDEQIFGENEDQSIIKCGSYTGNGSSSGPVIDLGWEPQWLLLKNASSAYTWLLFDNMRGLPVGSHGNYLQPNSSSAEGTVLGVDLTPTGFKITNSSFSANISGDNIIYIAIRRGPMKTPTDATTIFKQLAYSGSSSAQSLTIGFPGDFFLAKDRASGQSSVVADKLRGSRKILYTARTDSDETLTGEGISFTNDTLELGTTIPNYGIYNSPSGYSYAGYVFRRAPGFFDMVAYTGTGSNQSISHGLEVAPELLICKVRSTSDAWFVYAAPLGADKQIRFDTNGAGNASVAVWQQTTPTSTQFFVGTETGVNRAANTFIAYLFATCPGVSKVGSYTGTGTTLNVDCGFTSGARFVLIKRTDSTGDWYVWDTARGIVSGNDPYLLLNSTAAEVTTTDYIDPYTSGFTVTSTAPAALNASGGNYIFLAIA